MAKMNRMKPFFFLSLIFSFLLISAVATDQPSNNDDEKQANLGEDPTDQGFYYRGGYGGGHGGYGGGGHGGYGGGHGGYGGGGHGGYGGGHGGYGGGGRGGHGGGGGGGWGQHGR